MHKAGKDGRNNDDRCNTDDHSRHEEAGYTLDGSASTPTDDVAGANYREDDHHHPGDDRYPEGGHFRSLEDVHDHCQAGGHSLAGVHCRGDAYCREDVHFQGDGYSPEDGHCWGHAHSPEDDFPVKDVGAVEWPDERMVVFVQESDAP